MIGSNGVPLSNGGRRYVREQRVLDLMTALRKMSLMVAQRPEPFVPAMCRKGRIAVGADADVTTFDPASVTDRAMRFS